MKDFTEEDIDFKFCANRNGVFVIQADVKVTGISLDIIKDNVEKGVEANHN